VGELDIIAKRLNIVVAIEVKSHLHLHEGTVSQQQIQRNQNAFLLFLAKHPEYATYDHRLDVMWINNSRIRHEKGITL